MTHHNELDARRLPPDRDASSTSSACIVGGLERSTRSAGSSATRASRTSTTPSSRCSSGTRRTRTTATRWRASRSSWSAPRSRCYGHDRVTFRGHELDLRRPVASASASSTRSRSTGSGRATRTSSGAGSTSAGVDTDADKDWAQLVDHAVPHFVEPCLVEPTFLHDYPVELSPFARTTDDDPTLVERFEGFVGGMELCNAFSELNDPASRRQRFDAGRSGGSVEAEPGRPGLRRGALVRDAAHGRARLRRSTGSRWCSRAGLDPRRGPLPGPARAVGARRISPLQGGRRLPALPELLCPLVVCPHGHALLGMTCAVVAEPLDRAGDSLVEWNLGVEAEQ